MPGSEVACFIIILAWNYSFNINWRTANPKCPALPVTLPRNKELTENWETSPPGDAVLLKNDTTARLSVESPPMSVTLCLIGSFISRFRLVITSLPQFYRFPIKADPATKPHYSHTTCYPERAGLFKRRRWKWKIFSRHQIASKSKSAHPNPVPNDRGPF